MVPSINNSSSSKVIDVLYREKKAFLPQGSQSYKRNAMCMHKMLHQVEVPTTIR